jgi:galactofuranose transport system ATP-binding protein
MPGPSNDIVVMTGIDKSFPGVRALEGVDFSLARGEIHALVGENGAGKSTLIKILTGVDRADEGTIEFEGKVVSIRSPYQAQALGISTVYQEVNLCPNLTVAENLLIGRQPTRFHLSVDWKTINAKARRLMEDLDVGIDVTQPLGSYSIAIQQMAAIARALTVANAKVLILDEPTSSLTAHETERLFAVMKKLRSDGLAVVFITHFLDQVYAVSDRTTVLRNGTRVGTYPTDSLSRLELIKLMLGRTFSDLDAMTAHKVASIHGVSEDAILEATGLGLSGTIEPFDLSLHRGEVVGLAGILGAGRTELANLLFGVDRPDSGTLTVSNKQVDNYSPSASINRGVALCPEDRKAEGILGELTVRENIVLALQAGRPWFRQIGPKEQYELADKYMKLLSIKASSADQKVTNLSGGNQQKVILARWLAADPQVLILDEPTRGIDVGTKADIQRLVLSLAEEGKSCVFISSELDEVLRTSHRVVVMRDRSKVGEFSGEIDEMEIMHAIAGAAQ